MTTQRENDTLTRVGPGTPMGELMRRYWIPAAMSSELKADGDPVRLLILCEQLIAFRDSNGKVGIMDHRCPHRCASLFFGRNEEGGIRCVYHGWKFDADGNCVDMANVPAHQDFKHKVHAKAYKTFERNGVVWVYMGDQGENGAKVPAPPDIPATLRPAEDMKIWAAQRECNWLQGLEGELDTSHLGILHLGHAHKGSDFLQETHKYATANRTPEYALADTDVGCMYGAYRPAEADSFYWRVGHFAMPFWAMMPILPIERCILARAYVPMDDTHTMIFIWGDKRGNPRTSDSNGGDFIVGYTHNPQFHENSTDWYGRFRLKSNQRNDYLIDRAVQRTQSPSGIEGVHIQDEAVTTSMGAIADRPFEHLGPSDQMITRVRRRLLAAATGLAADGAVPPGASRPDAYANIRSGNYVTVGDPADWERVYWDKVAWARSILDPVPRAAE
jgi:phenylpropionate dioxygenase-like ring-hydroxylating dioxygenase large terminal subunit